MAEYTMIARDPLTGISITGQTYHLRRAPGYSINNYTFVEVDSVNYPGVYKATGVTAGKYKLWKGSTEDQTHGIKDILDSDEVFYKSGGNMTGAINMDGNRILNLPDPADNNEPEKKGRVATAIANAVSDIMTALGNYLPLGGGNMTGDLNMNNKKLKGLPIASANDEALSRGEGDGRYIGKGPGSAEQIYRTLLFRVAPYCLEDPTTLLQMPNVKFVLDKIKEAILEYSGTVTDFQQSNNQLRIIHSGVQEDGKVYRTTELGVSRASSYATSDQPFVLIFQGQGDIANLPNCNLLPVTIPPHVSFIAEGKYIMLMAEDEYVFDETNVFVGITFDNANESAVTFIDGGVYINCRWINSYGPGATWNLENAVLIGCTYEGVTVNLTACIGDILDTGNNKKINLMDVMNNNDQVIINQAGDVQGRRQLGRQAANIVAAETITIGEGNYAIISGSTGIKWMKNIGFTAGSIVILEFTHALTIINSELPVDGEDAGFIFKAGADKVITPGESITLYLNSALTFWREL